MAYIGDQLDIFAGKTPDGTALTCGAVEVSWRDLFRAIGSAENHIRRLSPRGGRIALLLRDPAELIVWFFSPVPARRALRWSWTPTGRQRRKRPSLPE
ncbi:hypothetical protein QW131_24480 [Roseibium salinum]|nr:hypothetical protein [Roseibium salinum]